MNPSSPLTPDQSAADSQLDSGAKSAGSDSERPLSPCERLDRAHARVAELRAQGLYKRGPSVTAKTLRKAIRAQCEWCQGGYADPGLHERIKSCGITRCALHAFRPYRSDEGEANE